MVIYNFKTEKSIENLNLHLSERSYIEGWQPSQADVAVFEALDETPTLANIHVLRWYNHIKTYDHKSLCGDKLLENLDKKTIQSKKDSKDDDFDLFGSDNDDDIETVKIREERLKLYAEKKAKKPALIAKSSIVIDVKPWDDETNMANMEKAVRSIQSDGLIWGASKLVAVGYGIQKLQIMCVVEDEKVSVDALVEQIQNFEELVQSVDIAAFNKI